ncbi:MAG: glycosyltransferase family 2 protein [Microcystaceae cyanobacterium]
MTIPSISDYQRKLEAQPILQSGGMAILEQPTSGRILISIITVVYNAEAELEATIQNVINQSYPYIEYIVIDGGSTDKTLEIIRQYEDKIHHWISQPDEGIYDAMNKGIALANGQIIGLINAGDTYTQDALKEVVEVFKSNPDAIITGNCQFFLEDGNKWMIAQGDYKKIPLQMLPHSSVFVPKDIYQTNGLFDLSFDIAADYDFLCRCYQKQIPFYFRPLVLSSAATRGKSGNYYLTEAEYFKIRLRYQLISPLRAIFRSTKSFSTITIHILLDKLGLWQWVETYRNQKTRL